MANDLKQRMLERGQQRSAATTERLRGMAARLQTIQAETAVSVPRTQIERDQSIQVRVGGLNEEKVVEYMTIIQNGGEMPPVILFRDEKTDKLYLADGFHRDEAEGRLGHDEVKAEIKPGGYAGAIEYAEEANLAHGLYLSYADKRNIFERRLKRGHEWLNASNREIARQLGVTHDTISEWRKKLSGGFPPDSGQAERTIQRGDQTYTMNTERIRETNQTRTARPVSAPEPPAPTPPVAAEGPEYPQASHEEIEASIVAALAAGDMVWHELLRVIKPMTGGEIGPSAFNQALRSLLDNGRIATSQHDQAAFALPGAMPQHDTPSQPESPRPPLDWDRSSSRQLMLLLNDLLALQDADLESEFTLLTQKTADKLRRNLAAVRGIMGQWEEWLA